MAFRFKFYAARDAAMPACTAPWLWLLRLRVTFAYLNADFGRMVDGRTGQVLEEWAQATLAGREASTETAANRGRGRGHAGVAGAADSASR